MKKDVNKLDQALIGLEKEYELVETHFSIEDYYRLGEMSGQEKEIDRQFNLMLEAFDSLGTVPGRYILDSNQVIMVEGSHMYFSIVFEHIIFNPQPIIKKWAKLFYFLHMIKPKTIQKEPETRFIKVVAKSESAWILDGVSSKRSNTGSVNIQKIGK